MRCNLCGDHQESEATKTADGWKITADLEAIIDHIRVMHPDHYSEPERWPDGGLVIHEDLTNLTVEDL